MKNPLMITSKMCRLCAKKRPIKCLKVQKVDEFRFHRKRTTLAVLCRRRTRWAWTSNFHCSLVKSWSIQADWVTSMTRYELTGEPHLHHRNSSKVTRHEPVWTAAFSLLGNLSLCRWIAALSEPTKQTVWKRNRNAHATALLQMLDRSFLEAHPN